jgi:hypothetical protein
MNDNRNGLPPDLVRLRTSRPQPSTAAILTGLQLIEAFLKISNDADRKKVLDLARQLAPVDADART